jgi:hypothetical protein
MSFSGSLLSGAAFYGSEYYGSGLIVGGFSPASLFAAGEVGAWYDPSDLTTLYQDTAGTTPVTTPGERVALMLDKSRGLVLGPELVTNGGFNTDTAWTKGVFGTGVAATISDGVGNLPRIDSSNFAHLSQTITGPAGWYRATITVVSSSVSLRAGTAALGTTYGNFALTAGTFTLVFFAAAANPVITVNCTANGATATIDNISVRELPGNHATQSVLAQRPTYAVEPVTGRRNLLTYSEDLSNVIWNKRNSSVAVDGSYENSNFYKITAGASTFFTGIDQDLRSLLGNEGTAVAPTITLVVAQDGHRYVQIATETSNAFVNFDLAEGVASPSAGASGSIADLGGGFVKLTANLTSGATFCSFYLIPSLASARKAAFTGPGEFVRATRMQFELGSTATAYQRVVTAQDVSEAGVAARHYLFFDGIDDGMLTGTITPGADKAQVFAGVRKLSDAARGTIAELTASAAANNGAFHLTAPNAASDTFAFESKGTSLTDAVASGIAAPASRVLAGLGDIAGDTATLRVNGVQADQDTGDQGTGNYAAAVLYLGRRGGASLPFSGHLYGAVVRFSAVNLAAASIAATERWMAQRTGVVI